MIEIVAENYLWAKKKVKKKENKIRIKIETRRENRIREREKGGEEQAGDSQSDFEATVIELAPLIHGLGRDVSCTLSKVENDTIYGNLRLRCYSCQNEDHSRK